MHSVDSTQMRQPEEGSFSSTGSLPLQSLKSGEKLERENDGAVEVVKIDGAEIHLRKFISQASGPVALYLHGIEGHSQWFANTASLLNKAGISIYAPDRRGAGLNNFERGHVQDARTLISDIEFFLKLMEEKHPQSPLFLIGNCWAAKAAALIAADSHKWSTAGRKPQLNGLILICPAIKTKPDLSFAQKLSIGWALIAGGSALKLELPIPLTCDMFTDNPVFLSYIDKDPRRLKSASRAFYFASWVLSLKSAKVAGNIHVPTFILQSDNDAIVDVAGIESWYAQISAADKKLKLYSGAAHSMDFDKRHFSQYAGDLTDWIIAHGQKRGPAQ